MLGLSFLFCIGLALLVSGAWMLVFSASSLAAKLGIPPLLVGLSVVSFGTSAPELGVSLVASLQGESALLVGNVVGSNILNILLVLGLSALCFPLVVQKAVIWKEVPIMIAISVGFWLLLLQKTLPAWQGVFFLGALLLYLIYLACSVKKEPSSYQPRSLPITLITLALSLILIALGSKWMVDSGEKIGHLLGISELIVGLTILAIGTSLPELATTLIALLKGKKELAVGNVIGSNIFNLLGVFGISLLFSGGVDVPFQALSFDIPIMVGASLATLPIFITGHKISRSEGGLFFAYYLLYLVYLGLSTIQSPHLTQLRWAFFLFILPLTLVTLAVMLFRHYRKL